MHYYLITTEEFIKSTFTGTLVEKLDRWNARLKHIHKEAIQNMCRHEIVDGYLINFTK